MSAHDELLKIHGILQAPGACPDSTVDDTLTVRMLKDLIHHWRNQQRETPQKAAAQTEAIALAYGYLWHVNEEPFAPIPTYTPQRAAYDARLILRNMMTHEQRGEAINKVRAMLERCGPPGRGTRGVCNPPVAMQQSQSDNIVAGVLETPNVELTGAAAGLSPQRPATEGSEVERRVGGAVPPAPTFEGDEK